MFHLFNADKKLIDAEGVLKGLKETVKSKFFYLLPTYLKQLE